VAQQPLTAAMTSLAGRRMRRAALSRHPFAAGSEARFYIRYIRARESRPSAGGIFGARDIRHRVSRTCRRLKN